MKTIATTVIAFVAGLALVACAGNAAPDSVGPSTQDLTLTPIAGSSACVETALCIQGTHWDSTQCKCAPNQCVSDEGGPCGGFTQNPCKCAANLVCAANPIPDVPGKCEPQTCCPVSWDMNKCKEPTSAVSLNRALRKRRTACLRSASTKARATTSRPAGGCDDSPNTHATKHHHETKHPIIEGYDPPEGRGDCYIDDAMIELDHQTPHNGKIPRYV